MSVNKERLAKQITPKLKICLNHPDRTASHQLLRPATAPHLFYCEKCAIKLASQGQSVLRLNPTPKRRLTSLTTQQKPKRIDGVALRRADISRFLMEIKKTKDSLQKNSLKLQEYLIRSQSEFGLMIEAINEFFTSIQQIVEVQKYTALNNVLNKRTSHEAYARFMKANVRQQIQDVSSIMRDIEENMDGVQEVQYSVYHQIMNGYQAKLSCMEDSQREIKNMEPVQKFNLQFPDFPKNLETLANQIIIKTHKAYQFVSHMNSQVYKVVTEETENQSSFLSEIPFKKQSLFPEIKGKIINYNDENSFGNMTYTEELAFSFQNSLTHSKGGASFRQLDFENQMFHSNCVDGSWGTGRKERDVRDSHQFQTFLKQRSLISEAETLLIA